MSKSFLLVQLRWIENFLSHFPRSLATRLHPGVLLRLLRQSLGVLYTLVLRTGVITARSVAYLLRLTGTGVCFLIRGVTRLLGCVVQRVRQLPRLSLPISHASGQVPALICVLATLFASVITLSPNAGERWSQEAYPTVAAIDQMLAPHGVLIGPELESDVTHSRPMIAVVFGRIMPDDTVEEESDIASTQTEGDATDEIIDEPEVTFLHDVTRPAGWRKGAALERVTFPQRGSRSAPKGMSPEAYEIRD